MPEPPDILPPCPKPKPPLGKRVRAWTILLVFYGAIAGMAIAAIPQLRDAFHSGGAWEDRAVSAMWGVLLLLPLAFMARYFVRVRLTTGRWRGTAEQRQQDRERRLAKRTARGGVPGVGATCATGAGWQTSWPGYLLKWGSYSAMEPTCPRWQRAAGWAVLVAGVLAWLAAIGFVLVCFGAAFDATNTFSQSVLFAALGLLFSLLPAFALRAFLRGLRAGKLGATREDLDQIRAQWAARNMREYSKPLREKVTTTILAVAVIGFLLLWKARRHPKDVSDLWIDAVVYGLPLLYVTWRQFRRPKDVPARDSAPPPGSES